jgi:oligopeptide/dipeptide ABC transporter ATP-binding protein
MLVRMYKADSGNILYNDNGQTISVNDLKQEELRQYREKVRYVFQDPARSLNPLMSVYEVLVSGCRKPLKRRGVSEKQLREKAAAILEEVGLQAADLEKRPSDFSGGQRQRISIARSLLMEPEVLICDEVVSALDVSIQGQILNLLLDIREKRGMSFLFIAHDLKVACYFCDRIGVMYRGELMEEAPSADLFNEARHPYTQLLFSCAAGISEESKEADSQNQVSRPARSSPLQGKIGESCSFASRCSAATERCFREHRVHVVELYQIAFGKTEAVFIGR